LLHPSCSDSSRSADATERVFTLYTTSVMAKSPASSLLIVNREPTPLDDLADAVLYGEAGTLLPALVERALAGTGTDR
jgi:NAD-dependent SIR2 family protein deacetylase